MARSGSQERGVFERPKGSGIYWVRYHDHRGKERREKVGSKSAAQKLYAKRKQQATERKKLGDLRAKELTLAEVIDTYLPIVLRDKPRPTASDYERYAEWWRKHLGDEIIQDIEYTQLEALKTKLLAGRKPATVNRYVAVLRRLCNLAVRAGDIPANPLDPVEDIPERNTRNRILRPEEEERLLPELNQDGQDIVCLALWTGARRESIFALEQDRVDLSRGTITYRDKNGSLHTVYLAEPALDILRRRLEAENRWVFPSRKNPATHRCARAWSRFQWRPALKRAGIRDLVFHDLKHTFVSRHLEQGTDVKTVQELVNHKTLSMTAQRYASLSPAHLRREAQNIVARRTATLEIVGGPPDVLAIYWCGCAERQEAAAVDLHCEEHGKPLVRLDLHATGT